MSTAGCFVCNGSDVWLLANATVYEAREVASEFNDHDARFYQVIKAIQFFFVLLTVVLPSLRRLNTKQAKLIEKLESSDQEGWDLESCREMSDLLHDLVLDEGNFIEKGWEAMKRMAPPVVTHLATLREQLRQLEAISVRLDALSVPEVSTPGDADCREFITSLAGPDEFDFSAEPDTKRAVSYA